MDKESSQGIRQSMPWKMILLISLGVILGVFLGITLVSLFFADGKPTHKAFTFINRTQELSPGYTMVGHTAVWTPGLKHPQYPHIYSGTDENTWLPEIGYRFISKDSLIVKWVPGVIVPGMDFVKTGDLENSYVQKSNCSNCGNSGKIKNYCGNCSGTGKIDAVLTCHNCNGLGVVSCRYCNAGKTDCNMWYHYNISSPKNVLPNKCVRCGSSEFVKTSSYSQVQFVNIYSPTQTIEYPLGYLKAYKIDCSTCNGSGNVQCHGCQGTATVNQVQRCQTCNGYGYCVSVCEGCNGEGILWVPAKDEIPLQVERMRSAIRNNLSNAFIGKVSQNTQTKRDSRKSQAVMDDVTQQQQMQMQMQNQMMNQMMNQIMTNSDSFQPTPPSSNSIPAYKANYTRTCPIHGETYDIRYGSGCAKCRAPQFGL